MVTPASDKTSRVLLNRTNCRNAGRRIDKWARNNILELSSLAVFHFVLHDHVDNITNTILTFMDHIYETLNQYVFYIMFFG
jgi:hypothetical protein